MNDRRSPSVSARVGRRRSITLFCPSTLSLRLPSDQTPSFLVASRETCPVPFGPLTEKLKAASPLEPLVEILPVGRPVVIGFPRRLATSGLASRLATPSR